MRMGQDKKRKDKPLHATRSKSFESASVDVRECNMHWFSSPLTFGGFSRNILEHFHDQPLFLNLPSEKEGRAVTTGTKTCVDDREMSGLRSNSPLVLNDKENP